MLARTLIAALLLINYLLVVGMGCISRPEDQHELVLVQTNVAGHDYQQCRYLRMDGLEAFLNEALASRYHNAPETAPHQMISVVSGVDAHSLPDKYSPILTATYQPAPAPLVVTYQLPILTGVHHSIDVPPWLG